jgi:quercetin dioxygenase-like cupin family protein
MRRVGRRRADRTRRARRDRGPPEIHRRQAFAKPGLWAGLTTTEPGLVSGWHHHGGHDTIVYVISGSVAIEFGQGGRQAVQGAPATSC